MSSNNANSSSTGTARIQEYASRVPIISLSIMIVNITVHIIIFVTSFSLMHFAMNPMFVVYRQEYYRIITSAFTHVGLMHIGMNMMTMAQLGFSIEAQFGSMKFLFLSIWTVLLTGVVFIALIWTLTLMSQNPSAMNTSAVGYSGVLFAYAIIESYHTVETSRSVFGFFSVPAKLYPFVLLVVLSLIMPGISFTGHLAGVIVGLIVVSPAVYFFMPSDDCLAAIESSRCCGLLAKRGNYVLLKEKSLCVSSSGSSSSNNCSLQGLSYGCDLVGAGLTTVASFVGGVLYTSMLAVGLPVETMTIAVSNCWQRFSSAISAFARQLPGIHRNPVENRPNYRVVPTEQDIENLELPTTIASNNTGTVAGAADGRATISGGDNVRFYRNSERYKNTTGHNHTTATNKSDDVINI